MFSWFTRSKASTEEENSSYEGDEKVEQLDKSTIQVEILGAELDLSNGTALKIDQEKTRTNDTLNQELLEGADDENIIVLEGQVTKSQCYTLAPNGFVSIQRQPANSDNGQLSSEFKAGTPEAISAAKGLQYITSSVNPHPLESTDKEDNNDVETTDILPSDALNALKDSLEGVADVKSIGDSDFHEGPQNEEISSFISMAKLKQEGTFNPTCSDAIELHNSGDHDMTTVSRLNSNAQNATLPPSQSSDRGKMESAPPEARQTDRVLLKSSRDQEEISTEPVKGAISQTRNDFLRVIEDVPDQTSLFKITSAKLSRQQPNATGWLLDNKSSLMPVGDEVEHNHLIFDFSLESDDMTIDSTASFAINAEPIVESNTYRGVDVMSDDNKTPKMANKGETSWSFLGFKQVKRDQERKSNVINIDDSETVLANNRSTETFDCDEIHDDSEDASMGKSSIGGNVQAIEKIMIENESVLISRDMDRKSEMANWATLGIHKEGEIIDSEDESSLVTHGFLVDDAILAKTLSIYQSITEEEGILLESFRHGDTDTNCHNKITSQGGSEPNSISQLKKIRSVTPRETSHESQALFDILDRDFSTVSARVLVSIGGSDGMRRAMTADDVKLCFAAFVSCFTPPTKSHFAQEYNYDLDNGIDSSYQEEDGRSIRSHASDNPEDYSDPERFPRPFVPLHIVNALWKDVIKCSFLDRKDLKKGFASKIESATDDVFSSALPFLLDTLVLLGVLDVRKVSGSANMSTGGDDELMLSTSDSFQFLREPGERRVTVDEVISVHQDIHQEYGEYLLSLEHQSSLHKLVEKYEKRWNSVISEACTPNSGNRNEASYAVLMLPSTTIRSNCFMKTAALLVDKKFIHGRIQALGILEGTTAQATDMEELILRYFNKKNGILCFDSLDPDETMVDAYEKTKRIILRKIADAEDIGQCTEDDPRHSVHARQLRKLRRDAGMALHLMGVSIGSQGFVAEEMDFCMSALSLKRASIIGGDSRSVTISDTLHCIGYSLDKTGKYLQAMEYYDEALTIRKRMLGDDDLRVSESLHNKGAIFCENGECESALACLEEALRIRTLHHGEIHESCADTQQWLGNVMRESGQYEQALDFFRSALQVKKSTLGVDHEEVANTLQNMAVVLDDMEMHSVSLDCYEEALRIYTLVFGRDNQKVADTLQRMAINYAITEQNEQSLFIIDEAIEIREKILLNNVNAASKHKVVQSLIFSPEIDLDEVETRIGSLIECYEESIHLTKALNRSEGESLGKIQHRLGDLYFESNDWEKSVEYFQGALQIHRALADVGTLDEVEVCDILHKTGVVHLCKQEYQKAKSCFETVIYRRRMTEYKDLNAEATSLYCLGVTLNHLKVHKLALASLTEALRIWTEIYGENNVLCGYALYWIGRQGAQLQELDKALTWYRGALKTFKSNKSNVDYAAVAKTLELLGMIHEQLGDLTAALKCYNEGVRLVRWKFGDFHSFTIDMLCRCGSISEKQGRPSEAIEFLEDAISVMKACDRECDSQLCDIMEKLGLLEETEGRIDIAKTTLSNAYRLWEATVGQNDLRTAKAVWNLGRVLDKQGSRDAAMQCYRECLRVQKLGLRPGDRNIAETLCSMGVNLSERESYDEAITCYQQALSIQRNAFGDNSVVVASTLHNLAKGYQEIGSFDKSVVCFKEALRINKASDKENAMDISEISFGMALSHEANNNFRAAIEFLNCALKIWRETPSDDPRISIVLQKLGTIYGKIGDNTESVVCYTEALALISNDEDNLKLIAVVLSGLAKSYSLTGSHDGAIEMYQRHIDLMKSNPENREIVADSLYAMGSIYARLDNYDDAIMHFQDCLLVRKKCFGSDDERVGRVLVNMGVVFDKREDLKSAKDCFLEALRINKVNANDREITVNLKDLGRVQAKQNDLSGALEYYMEALQLSKKSLGPGDSQVADLLHTCAALMFDLQEYTSALISFKDSLRIRQGKLGPTCVETGETLFMIGKTLQRSGNFDEALDFLKESLSVLLVAKGSECLEAGNYNHEIGVTFVAKEDFEAGIPYFLEALPIRQKFFGDEEIEVALTIFQLADSYRRLGDWENALEYAVKALRIRKLRCGDQSLECAESLKQLGEIHLALLKYSEAQKCFIEAFRVYTVVHGKGHITVATCLEKIGTTYLSQDQLNNATDNLRRALKLFTENVGGISSQVAKVLLTIGRVEAKKGASDIAIDYFKQSLSISKELDQDALVAAALLEIGAVLESCGKKVEAMECYKESLRLSTGAEARETRAQALNRIGSALAELREFDEALQVFDEALTVNKNLKGDKCVEVGQTIHNIAGVYEAMADFDKSQKLFQEAHAILIDKLGPNDLAVALVLNNLGINHARRKEFSTAVELCSEALSVRKDILGMKHLDTCDALYNLATILDEWGKQPEAMKFFNEALESYRSALGDDDVEVANCLKLIGNLHSINGEDDLATRAFVDALRIYQVEEEENSEISDILFNLGKLYTKMEQHEKALEMLAQCLRIRKSENKEGHAEIAETCLQIGTVYATKELPKEAKKFFERALSIYNDNGREVTIERAQVMASLAKVLSVEESYDKALQLFHDALEIFKQVVGEDTDDVAEVLISIGVIHNKRVDYEEALKFLSSSLKIRSKLFGQDDMKVASTLFEIGQVMEEWGDSEEVSLIKVNAMSTSVQHLKHAASGHRYIL